MHTILLKDLGQWTISLIIELIENYDIDEVDKLIKKNLKLGNVHKFHGKILREEKINGYLYIENEIFKLLNNINLEDFEVIQ